MKLVLASGSPRRRELLGNIGLSFDIVVDNSDEEFVKGEHPSETVKRLSMQKALNVAGKIASNAIVIGADTVVSIDGKILGKPKDEAEAEEMLNRLSGRSNTVYTGLAVVNKSLGKTVSDFESTDVKFRELSHDEIKAYVKSGEPMDKAGAYGIQNLGALLIEGIDGDYFNVVGLPICKLGKILERDFGVKILGCAD